MGILSRLSYRSEKKPTDATVEAIQQLEPRMHAKAVTTICPEGHDHYGIVLTLPPNVGSDYMVLTRCFPNWYGQSVTRAAAAQFYAAGESAAYRQERATGLHDTQVYGFTRFGPANAHPTVFATMLVQTVKELQ